MVRTTPAAAVRPTLLFVALLLAAAFGWSPRAGAQATGRIVGRIMDATTGQPVSGAAVAVPQLRRGDLTGEDGRYEIGGLPAGTYDVRVTHVGYETAARQGLVIEIGGTATADFSVRPEVLRQKAVEVSGKRPLVEVKVPTSRHTLLAEDIENVPIQNVQDIVQRQAGIVQQDNELHIRGGRGDEVVYYTEGVREKDALTGKPIQSALSPRAIQEISVISGGFEAEFNDALSGVVQVTMKEGNPARYAAFSSYERGSFDTDVYDFQLGGPEPILGKLLPLLGIHIAGEKTFYLDAGAELSNTYLPGIKDISSSMSIHSGYRDHLFGQEFSYGRFFTPRQDNVWRAALNSTWQPRGGRKFKLYFSKRIQINQGFGDAQVGDLTRLTTSYPWQWSRALDHYTTQLSDNNTASVSWTEAFGRRGFQELRLARTFTGAQRDVDGKLWFDYAQGFNDFAANDTVGSYFFPSGDTISDGPDWRNYFLQSTLVDYKLTRTWEPHHKVDAGANVSFQDAQWARINCPCDSLTNNFGRDYDVFHVYPTTGNLYLQDHVDYQGLSGHVGVGYMFWVPGALADRVLADTTRTDIVPAVRDAYASSTSSLFGRRVKSRWTPRLAVAYPITDHTKFFFNYGRYAQWPTYYYVYTRLLPSRSSQFPQKGNPALNPEVSVNYEVGGEHQFSSTMAFKIAVYNKDLYDYVTSTFIPGPPSFVQFYNQDYARSRGVELEVRKRRTGALSGALTYTYSQATGKGSDPNEILIARQSGAPGFDEAQPREVNLYWNRPHKFTLNVDYRINPGEEAPRVFGVRVPSGWGLNVFGTLTSGLAYTPQANCGVRDCPDVGPPFSKNGPFENHWDLRFDKSWHLTGLPVRTTLEVYNIFDAKVPTRIDPRTGRGYVLGYGTAGIDATDPRTIDRYSDPSYYASPRQFRAGLELAW